jgi:hypothetical protein
MTFATFELCDFFRFVEYLGCPYRRGASMRAKMDCHAQLDPEAEIEPTDTEEVSGSVHNI